MSNQDKMYRRGFKPIFVLLLTAGFFAVPSVVAGSDNKTIIESVTIDVTKTTEIELNDNNNTICESTDEWIRECVFPDECDSNSRVLNSTLLCSISDTVCCENATDGSLTRISRANPYGIPEYGSSPYDGPSLPYVPPAGYGTRLPEIYDGKGAPYHDVNKAVDYGMEYLGERDSLEKELLNKGLYVKPYTSEAMYNEYLKPDDKALQSERRSFVIFQAIKYLAFKAGDESKTYAQPAYGSNQGSYSSGGAQYGGSDQYGAGQYGSSGSQYGVGAAKKVGEEYATSEPYVTGSYSKALYDSVSSGDYAKGTSPYPERYTKECVATKYRTLDGHCNNLKYPEWGRAFRVYNRLTGASYGDGISTPRRAKDGYYLPNARLISSSICHDKSYPIYQNTLMVMQWGQFIDHDMSFTPIYKARGSNGILCCAREIQYNQKLLHPECYPILIPKNDYFYSRHNSGCMEFVRSLAGTSYEKTYGGSGKRQQLNQVSSFIDGSLIYGSSLEETKSLRTYKYGTLITVVRYGKEYIPIHTDPYCRDPSLCYRVLTGDIRANMHPWLTVLHTLFVREHNKIANALYKINPDWDDEYLFQETRRIISAILQHITYNEFIPALFGYDLIEKYGIGLKNYGYSNDYNDYLNPTSLNEFASAAFRMGHSLIYGTIEYRSREYGRGSLGNLRDHYFSPYETIQPGVMDKYLVSLFTQWQEKVDVHVTKEVTNYLFKTKNSTYGLDLIALNIHRGRDHGLPGYNEYRKICGLKKVYSFDELYPSIDRDVISKLKYLYKSVDDIDLYIGGIAEKHNRYSLLGPTFACIIANQFRRVKKGDRFWYELGGQPSSFTPEQLREIRKVHLSRLICNNADNINYVQQWVFKTASKRNPYLTCKGSYIPAIDLTKWKSSYQKGYESKDSGYSEAGSYSEKQPSYGPTYDTGKSYDAGTAYGAEYGAGAAYGGGESYGEAAAGGGSTYDSVAAGVESGVSGVDSYGGGAAEVGSTYDAGYKEAETYGGVGSSSYDSGYAGGDSYGTPAGGDAYDKGYSAGDGYVESAGGSSYDSGVVTTYGDTAGGAAYDSSYGGAGDTYGGAASVLGGESAYDSGYNAESSVANVGDTVYAKLTETIPERPTYDSGYTSESTYGGPSGGAPEAYGGAAYDSGYKAPETYGGAAYDSGYKAPETYGGAAYDSGYKVSESASGAAYDSGYKAPETYGGPAYDSGYKAPETYGGAAYDSGYKASVSSSGAAYDSGYKAPETYGGAAYDSGYKVSESSSGAAYDSGYKAPETYGGPAYDSGYKAPETYGGAAYDSGYKVSESSSGAAYDSGYKAPETYGGAAYDSGYKASESSSGAAYDSGYTAPETYGGPAYDSGYKAPETYGGAAYDSGYKVSESSSGAAYDSGYKAPETYGGAAYDSGYKASESSSGAAYDSGYKAPETYGGAAYDSGYKAEDSYGGAKLAGSAYDSVNEEIESQGEYSVGPSYEAGNLGAETYVGPSLGHAEADNYGGISTLGLDGGGYTGGISNVGSELVGGVGYNEPSYSSAAESSKSAYDSAYAAGSESDQAKGSAYDAEAEAYDKEASVYDTKTDSYADKEYAKKESEADYYAKGSTYEDHQYAAKRKYHESKYGANKAYEDSVYSSQKYGTHQAKGDHKESDAATEGEKGSYSASSYGDKYKADDSDRTAGSTTYSKEHDDDYKSSSKDSYSKTAASKEQSVPTYTAPVTYSAPAAAYDSGYGDSEYRGPTYSGSSYGGPTDSGSSYGGPRYEDRDYEAARYSESRYDPRYPRSHSDEETTETNIETEEKDTTQESNDDNENLELSTASTVEGEEFEKPEDDREERSYGEYNAGGYGESYEPPPPAYASAASASKASYDSSSKSAADHDAAKSSDYGAEDRYYDKEAAKYDTSKDSYAAAASAKKHSEGDYYGKDASYGEKRYGAHKKYHESRYGANKGYEDSVYSSDRYSTENAKADRKEYDAAADRKKDSYDASSYGAREKADASDRKTDSSYYSKEHDDASKASQTDSYSKTAAAKEQSVPTYTAPAPAYPAPAASYDTGYGGPSYEGGGYGGPTYDDTAYGGSGYDQRYPRSQSVETETDYTRNDDETTPIEEADSTTHEKVTDITEDGGESLDGTDNTETSTVNSDELEKPSDDREERSYGEYNPGGYGGSYEPPPPAYASASSASKASYDSSSKSAADHDAAKSSAYGAEDRYYDKEAAKYDTRKDSYSAADYGKKHSEGDYYGKDASYGEKRYGAHKKYHESRYGANKGYEDSVYSSDRYSTENAKADRKEYDVAADRKKASYDASSYGARERTDASDRKTDSSYYSKEHDDASKASQADSYSKTAAAKEQSVPTYTAPAPAYPAPAASYDTGYGGPSYERGGYGGPTYDDTAYGGPSYGGNGYDQRYPRSQSVETETDYTRNDDETTPIEEADSTTPEKVTDITEDGGESLDGIDNTETSTVNSDELEKPEADREERSYGGYNPGGYGGSYEPPPPAYASASSASKASYDSSSKSAADHDAAKSSAYGAEDRYYDKEAAKYDTRKDSYSAADYGKKHSEGDYYGKDASYGEKRYGAHKKYHESRYGANKGYEDSVYSSDRYSTENAKADRKEYDAAADRKKVSYDASSYGARERTDASDRKTDSSYYSKEHDDASKGSQAGSYTKTAAAEEQSVPTYTAPAPAPEPTYRAPAPTYARPAPSYDTGYEGESGYGGSPYGGPSYDNRGYGSSSYGDVGYDPRYPRSHSENEDAATDSTPMPSHDNMQEESSTDESPSETNQDEDVMSEVTTTEEVSHYDDDSDQSDITDESTVAPRNVDDDKNSHESSNLDNENEERKERSYGGYGGSYVQPQPPAYESADYVSKSAYDSAYKGDADHDAAKSSAYSAETQYRDKEAAKYAAATDSYKAADYGKKHTEADYYGKDAAYGDKRYGARRKYYESSYGARKAYEDSVYSANKKDDRHARGDHKEYDAAADRKKDSYDSSSYASRLKVDDSARRADSSSSSREHDDAYRASYKDSSRKTAAASEKSVPTYTSPPPTYAPPPVYRSGPRYRAPTRPAPGYGSRPYNG